MVTVPSTFTLWCIYLEPFDDPCLDWISGLLLEGWPSRIEVIWALGIYIYMNWDNHSRVKNKIIPFVLFPFTEWHCYCALKGIITYILLMEEIWLTTWDVENPANNGRNYQPQLVSLPDFWSINRIISYDLSHPQHELSQLHPDLRLDPIHHGLGGRKEWTSPHWEASSFIKEASSSWIIHVTSFSKSGSWLQ